MNLLNLNQYDKKRLVKLQAENSEIRKLTGRRVKLNEGELRKKCLQERDEHIQRNLGNFDLIYPPLKNKRLLENYDEIMYRAEHVYHKFTGAGDTAKVMGYERMLRTSLRPPQDAYKYSFNEVRKIYGAFGPQKQSKVKISKAQKKNIPSTEVLKNSLEHSMEQGSLEQSAIEEQTLKELYENNPILEFTPKKSNAQPNSPVS
jgi:hypothetical protein